MVVRDAVPVASLVVSALAFALVKRALPARRRDPSLWVFGARAGDGFVDNPKYLFLHVAHERPEIRPVWLSRDDAVVGELRAAGYEAYHVHSLRGSYLNLRAGVVLLSQGLSDVNLPCSGGATIVQLWHGIPLKTIGWDAEIPDRPALERRVYAYLAGHLDLVAVTAPALVEPFASAFRIDPDRIVVTGYPRLDALFGPVPGETVGLDPTTAAEVRRVAPDHPVVVYLPTYRDQPGDRATEHVDFDALQAFLVDRDAYLVVKLHPFEPFDPADHDHSRIIHVPSGSDVYPLLRHADGLVTDYSSVAFDFLLRDRPVAYYPYDLERYRRERGFYFEYAAVTPGTRASDFGGFLEALDAILDGDDFADERRAVRERFFSRPDAGQAALAFRTIGEHVRGTR